MNEMQREIIECALADGFTYKQDDTLEVLRALPDWTQFNSGKDMGEWWIKVTGNTTEKGRIFGQTIRRVTDEDMKQWRRDKKIDEILPNP